MYKYIKTSDAAGFGVRVSPQDRRSTITLPLEKMSETRAGQLNWLEKVSNIDPRISNWVKASELDHDRYTYTLVVPLGADESWEETVNGDAFERHDLRPEQEEWGHKTFERYAKAYKHHSNKDPSRGYGDHPLMVYNDEMDRCEGVWRLDNQKAEEVGAGDVVSKILSGKSPAISMGCFPAGTPISLADGSTKAIEEIQVGDRVLTHMGRARRVTSTFVRPYQDELVVLKLVGSRTPLALTPEHPVWGAGRGSVVLNKRWVDTPEPSWLHAAHLQAGDYLTFPAVYAPLTPDFATPALARLLGYYLAEGHLVRNKKGEYVCVEFTCHRDDVLCQEITSLCEQLGTRNEPVFRARANTPLAVSVAVHDAGLAELCLRLCGTYAKKKCLDESLMEWDEELLLHFLGAYFNGDGCQLKGTSHDRAGYLSTSSGQLASQLILLFARVGIPVGLNYIRHKGGSGFSARDTFEHQLRVGKQHIHLLAPYSKAEGKPPDKAYGGGRKLLNGHVWSKVNSVTRLHFSGQVFNFEVEEDESYLAGGFSVHNCKVKNDVCSMCGNEAKSPREYCEHPYRPGFGHIDPVSGVKMRVFNPHPKFFDLSAVSIPAAPEAVVLGHLFPELAAHIKSMEKVSSSSVLVLPSSYLGAAVWGVDASRYELRKASSSASAIKMSDLIKEIPLLESSIIRPMQLNEEPIEEEPLKTAGVDGIPLPAALSTLAAMGIVLTPQEFMTTVGLSHGHEECPCDCPPMDEISEVFPFADGNSSLLESAAYNPGLALNLRDLVPERSILFPHLAHRMVRSLGESPSERRVKPRVRIKIQVEGVPAAYLYASYIKTLAKKMGKILREVLSTYPRHEVDVLRNGHLTSSGLKGSARGYEKLSEFPAQALLPSAYVLAMAGHGKNSNALQESIKELHAPGVEHLFGGVVHVRGEG